MIEGDNNKFKNKYRISSARLSSWDYGNPGMYFITICTKDRVKYFGEIVNAQMHLNTFGKIAEQCWREIPEHFKNVELGEFIIMPNHVHGIIIINESVSVETGHALSLPRRFRNQGKNTISAMVGSFKSAVTKIARAVNPVFGWQSRFHDHIIRTADDYKRISNYIINNPANWREDKFYRRSS